MCAQAKGGNVSKTLPFEVRLAIDWWRTGGECTEARLVDLVRHHSAVYTRDAAYTDAAVEAARQWITKR